MITLYDDQARLVYKTRAALRTNKSVLVQSATGSGKTIIAASMIAGSVSKGTRSIFIVPRKTLLRQTAGTLSRYNIPFTYYADGYSYNRFCNTILGSAQTMGSRMDRLPAADVVFFDECHYGGAILDKIVKYYRARGSYIVGLSATPIKTNGRGMGEWFDTMVEGESIRWLIDNKRLSDFRFFAPSTPDLSGIKVTNGEYVQTHLNERMEQDSIIIGDAVRDYKRYAMGMRGLTFGTSRKHNHIIAEQYRNAGISAVAVDGTTPDDELKRVIQAFARREILQLVNCELLTFGFDLSAAAGMDVTIESMHDLQPTHSLAKQMQEWGRVLRFEVGKTALIFDHATNWTRHGLPDDEREWDLDGLKKRTAGERAVAVKQCEKCFYAHHPAPSCPNCGHVYPVRSREVEHVDGELHEVTREQREAMKAAAVKDRKKEQAAAKTLPELIALGKQRGMKNPHGWAANIMRARHST